VVQEAKAKELNDKVVAEATVLLSLPLEIVHLAHLEKLEVLLIPLHCRQPKEVYYY
jgi:hypothetical protein